MTEGTSPEASSSKPRVLLDSNILIANFRLGRTFKLLLDGARTEQLELIVPEVALREAANKFHEQCAEERRAVDRAMGKLSRIGVRVPDVSAIDPAAERVRYDRGLRKALRASKVRVPAISSVAHGDLVDRALQRRKPFKDNGAGYRDALLWATVLEEAATGPLLFFTMDKSDFAADGTLAPDLVEDLERITANASSVELRTDLKAFVATSVNVGLIAIDAVRHALPKAQSDVETFVRHVLFDVDLNRSDLRAIAGQHGDLVPEGMVSERLDVGDAQILEIHTVSAASVEKAEALSTGDVLAELYVEAEVTMDIEVDIIGHDARSGRPRFSSCFVPSRTVLGLDIDGSFSDDDLALLDLSFFGATVVPR